MAEAATEKKTIKTRLEEIVAGHKLVNSKRTRYPAVVNTFKEMSRSHVRSSLKGDILVSTREFRQDISDEPMLPSEAADFLLKNLEVPGLFYSDGCHALYGCPDNPTERLHVIYLRYRHGSDGAMLEAFLTYSTSLPDFRRR